MSVPTNEAMLVSYTANMGARLAADPESFNVSSAQLASFQATRASFVSAYEAVASAREGGVRSKPLTSAKNLAKAQLLRSAREIYGIIKSSLQVSDAQKVELGVLPPSRELSRVSPPARAPEVSVVSVTGRTVRYRLRNAELAASVARPASAEGATILTYVGNEPPPANHKAWRYHGQTSRSRFQVQYPNDVPAGTKVWALAMWYTYRGATSPASEPVGTYLQAGDAFHAA